MAELKDTAKYKVLIAFTDESDKKAPAGANVYWEGNSYPRDGYEPTKDRLDYLLSDKTRYKKPVIAAK